MKGIYKYIKVFFYITFIGVIVYACSTEKNTFINRTYHSTTAKYNGYFNAKELLRIGLINYRNNYRENFYDILPIDLLPNEEDVTEFYPIVDTAIAKCEKVISKHSMPTASKPSQKKTEYARWVDMNWILIGKSNFIRRDYQRAIDNFEYIRKFYANRSSTYIAQLWEAKCQIEFGELSNAQRTLQKLATRKSIYKADAKGKGKFSYRRQIKKDLKEDNKTDLSPIYPKDLDYEVEKTKARLALERKDNTQAIKHLEEALKLSRWKHRKEKARLYFIVGQLLQKEENTKARDYYTLSIKNHPPFEMEFQARINRAMVGGKGKDEIILELRKMLKEQKYLEYKDQIYYAMATVELSRDEVPQAKYFLSKSVFYSINNARQKGISYEKLGDLTYEERNYVHAQKYYDSSAQVIPEDYINYNLIHTKAEKLLELVTAVDIVAYEDSVQRIAMMSEGERAKFLEKVIEDLKEQERIRKEKEAQRAAELRELQMAQLAAAGEGNKFYFSNVKTMNQGFEEFRSTWGQRENEDYWRLSNKEPDLTFDDEEEESDTIPKEKDVKDVPVDELTPEILMQNIPLTDSAMAASNERLLASLYKSGMVYKEQLDEVEMGAKQFQRVVDHGVEDRHNVLSAYQLYEIYKSKNPSASSVQKNYILNNYPDSDYANYLRDPDYFIKKKEMDALAQEDYLRDVSRFERGVYFPVIQVADNVIQNEPDNIYRPQYFILKAMAMGQLNNDKTSLIPILEQAIEEFPDTDVAVRAEEMLTLIKNGVPEFQPYDFDAGSNMFKYSSKDKMIVLIYLSQNDDVRKTQTKVSDFNREFFSRDRLNTGSQIMKNNLTMVKVSEFKDEYHASDYLRDFKKTKKHLGDVRNKKIIYISIDNFKTLLKEGTIEDYEKFFKDYY